MSSGEGSDAKSSAAGSASGSEAPEKVVKDLENSEASDFEEAKKAHVEISLMFITDADSKEGKAYNNLSRASLYVNKKDSKPTKVGRLNEFPITSEYKYGKKGAEFSDLIFWDERLLTVCDKTGILFEINPANFSMVPRHIMSAVDDADDANHTTGKGFKGEWMTERNGELYVGGHGNPGEGRNSEMVYKFTKGHLMPEVEDWTEKYEAMFQAVFPDQVYGSKKSGYITHEAGAWSEERKRWIFLPRRVCPTPFDPETDAQRGAHLMIVATNDFKKIEVIKLKEDWNYGDDETKGFSSFVVVEGVVKRPFIAASRTVEVDGGNETYLDCLDFAGNYLMDTVLLGQMKFEGMAMEADSGMTPWPHTVEDVGKVIAAPKSRKFKKAVHSKKSKKGKGSDDEEEEEESKGSKKGSKKGSAAAKGTAASGKKAAKKASGTKKASAAGTATAKKGKKAAKKSDESSDA